MFWTIRILIWIATTAVMAVGVQQWFDISFWWGVAIVFLTGILPIGWLLHLVMFVAGLIYLNRVYEWV